MTQLAHVTEEHCGDTVVVGLSGEIDATNVKWLGSRIRAALSNLHAGLLLDATGLTYLDSAGIALIFALAGELGQRRLALAVIIDPESPVARLLSVAGVDQAVAVHPSREAALGPA